MMPKRPPDDRAYDERQLTALSLRDDWGLSIAKVGQEVGETRNTVLGWFARIDDADARCHGLANDNDADRRMLAQHRVAERRKVVPC